MRLIYCFSAILLSFSSSILFAMDSGVSSTFFLESTEAPLRLGRRNQLQRSKRNDKLREALKNSAEHIKEVQTALKNSGESKKPNSVPKNMLHHSEEQIPKLPLSSLNDLANSPVNEPIGQRQKSKSLDDKLKKVESFADVATPRVRNFNNGEKIGLLASLKKFRQPKIGKPKKVSTLLDKYRDSFFNYGSTLEEMSLEERKEVLQVYKFFLGSDPVFNNLKDRFNQLFFNNVTSARSH